MPEKYTRAPGGGGGGQSHEMFGDGREAAGAGTHVFQTNGPCLEIRALETVKGGRVVRRGGLDGVSKTKQK